MITRQLSVCNVLTVRHDSEAHTDTDHSPHMSSTGKLSAGCQDVWQVWISGFLFRLFWGHRKCNVVATFLSSQLSVDFSGNFPLLRPPRSSRVPGLDHHGLEVRWEWPQVVTCDLCSDCPPCLCDILASQIAPDLVHYICPVCPHLKECNWHLQDDLFCVFFIILSGNQSFK